MGTLRGLPFGQPPFLAFWAMAASLAGLFDLPPRLPISENHFRTADDGVSFVFIISRLSCPRHPKDGAGFLSNPVQSSPSSMMVTTGSPPSPGPHNDHSLTSSRRLPFHTLTRNRTRPVLPAVLIAQASIQSNIPKPAPDVLAFRQRFADFGNRRGECARRHGNRELEPGFPDKANRFRLHQVHKHAVLNGLPARINGDGFAEDVPKVSTARLHGVGLSSLSVISPAAIATTATRLPGGNPSLASQWPCNLIFGYVLRRKKSPAISTFNVREVMCYSLMGRAARFSGLPLVSYSFQLAWHGLFVWLWKEIFHHWHPTGDKTKA
jgi:hypothetical protein